MDLEQENNEDDNLKSASQSFRSTFNPQVELSNDAV